MKKTISHLLPLLLLCICCGTVLGQQRKTITGSVRDSAGNAIPGVSINLSGTKSNAAADSRGNFKISVPVSDAVLIFSSVGYTTKQVNVGKEDYLTVELSGAVGKLNEVVITGFGTRTSSLKVPYAIQSVGGAELARAGTVNVVNSLQGKIAGVMVNQGAGGPSSSSRIRIRGNSSLSGNTMPLYVIDGVLIQPGASGADSWGDNRDFGNQMKNLNPDDYESMTVLKGSAASALYGSQALSGVILITTKKGKARPGLGVTLNQTTTWNKVYRLPDFQNEYGGGNSPTFAKNSDGKDIIPNDDYAPYYSFGPKFAGQTVIDADGVTRVYKPNNMKDLYQTGLINNTNVSVEGGNDKTTVRFSYTKSAEQGIVSTNKFDRNSFALRATQKVGKLINMDFSINYAATVSKNPMQQGGQGSLLYRLAYSNSRNFPIDNLFANYIDAVNGGRVQKSPYLRGSITDDMWSIYQTNVAQKENSLLANLDITANITPWLSLLMRGNVNSYDVNQETKERGDGAGFNSNNFGRYALYTSNRKDARLQALLTATRKITNNLEFSLSAGGETQRGLGGTQLSANTNGGFKNADIFALSNSKNALDVSGGKYPQSRLDALYTYGDITWKEMLTLSGSFRSDWNSTLTYPDGHGTYVYNYPSIGASWLFTELLKDKKQFDFLSFGKLRASYGITGAGTGIYTTSSGNYVLNGNYTDLGATSVPRYGFQSNSLGNLNLVPLRAFETEIGVDLRFFNNRLRIDVAAYKKNTKNETIQLNAPPESGIDSRLINAGNIQNKGVEILLSGVPVRTKHFEWTTTVNFTRNRNKIIALYPGTDSRDLDLAFGNDVRSVAKVGEDFGTIVSTYAYARDPQTNQKLLQQDGTYWRSGAYGQGEKILGSAMEKYLVSNINEFRYKSFSLFIQVDAKVGGKIASTTHQYGSEYGNYQSTLFGRDAEHGGIAYTDANGVQRNDGIIPEGVFGKNTIINNIDVSGLTYADAVSKGLKKPIAALDYYEGIASWGTGIREYSVFDNTWVALREVSFGYDFPKSTISKLKINRLRLNVSGRNIIYLYTTTKDHIYPESIYSSRPGAFAETGGGPYQRQMAVSLLAGF
ncbi:SusC/RagA family TonB-linked outer membrane protein [Ferruginibacter paludis]|uniref:SusC/RagA family TonB-linked outer membrane protein n=1 Tax=Ferruginibacter TaxID=1004303 RepID=UPI0025B4BC14|nr:MULTISPECIES: SusC/RagA family TonB-linked outer membrane protein [Ferruginibacter]MDB5276213.1 SusC/RagA family TonB-linked outer membrane protein [Ferruginibacter sp.]MDN3655566.1 SusC/RagA family TonB-linked outer membrane protein [Ferruginibacter paludis]